MLCVLTSVFSSLASAQQTGGDDSTVVYPASYFTEWAPNTAQDMLDRIPGQENAGPRGGGGPPGGFGGNPASGGRGLGSGDGGTQILVNGKRTAGKNNATSGLLGSIAANQVREIQIIRGTSGELDVRGSGQVVNVVLFEELSSTSISYQAQMEYVQDDTIQPNGSVSISGMNGAFNYLLSLERRAGYRQSLANESSILGDFSPNDIVLEDRIQDSPNNELSLNLGYEINPNSSVRFNALYGINDGETTVDRVTTDLTTTPPGYLVEYESIPRDHNNWELGGDYELSLDNGDRFKLLAIANRDDDVNTRRRYQVMPDATREYNLFLNTDAITQERIVRSSYTTNLFDDQSVEFGIERAQTILDSKLRLGSLRAGTPSSSVEGLVPVPVSNANSKVEEIRYEPFVIHNWRLNSRMTLESTLVYETSEINQSGDVTRSRDFDFIKPKVDLRFDVTPALQVRGTIERIVNQLAFADFVASNDDEDDDSNTIAGNADLRQQTQWKYSFNTEYRFANDIGVINAELFYADHQDVIDFIDLSTGPNNLASARGNIGDGSERVLNINASIRGTWFGMPNLLLSPGLNLQDSSVTDPFLGIDRRFRFYQRGRFTFTFRHDIPEWRANWGMQYFDRTDGNMFAYDVEDFEFTVGEPRVNFFAEYIDSRGLTYRLDIGALTDGNQCRERWRYDGHIRNNVLSELEYRCTHTGVETSFRINGTF
jgi:hypothetical protein